MSAAQMFPQQPTESRKQVCEKHGEFESVRFRALGFMTEWTDCEQCDRERAAEEKRAESEAKYARALEFANIPPRFRNKGLENYRAETTGQQRALMMARAYADNFAEHRADGRCLIMVGRPGTGKTHLALGVGQQILSKSFSMRYVTVHDAIESIRETWRGDSGECESEVLKRYTRPDLLILDEVGVQYGKDSEQVELFKILNRRYNEVLPTIVISNVSSEELKKYLGERALDRLRENGGKVITFDWESERGK